MCTTLLTPRLAAAFVAIPAAFVAARAASPAAAFSQPRPCHSLLAAAIALRHSVRLRAPRSVPDARVCGVRQGFVCKVDMATGKAVWVTDVGLRVMGIYTRAIATTAAGHVLVSANYKLDGVNTGMLGKYDGSNGAHVWSASYSGTSVISSVQALDEIAYTSGLFKGFHVIPRTTPGSRHFTVQI